MLTRTLITGISFALPIVPAFGAYKDDVRYTELANELNLRGISIPTGAEVGVTQVEAREDTNRNDTLEINEGYTPSSSNSEFSGKTITDGSNLGQDPSNHGTWVGQNLYGNSTSISPGVTSISVYEANDFMNSGWYSGTPPTETNPLQNHSWVAWFQNSNSPTRMDYAVERDGFLPIVGVYNSSFPAQASDIPDTYGSIYNGITVGSSNGSHRYGTTTYDGSGRTKPEIVAPGGIPGLDPATQYTSFATPIITAAAAFLIDAAGSAFLIDAAVSDAAKDQLTLKAILLAGADKGISATWLQTTERPIDAVYGAGELDIYESYFIQQAGQQTASSTINERGWNLSSVSSSSSETYSINVPEGFELRNLSALLTWNRAVERTESGKGPFKTIEYTPTLANLSLSLTGAVSYSSDSPVDNIEHIWRDSSKALASGSYTLTVASSSSTSTEYALAWRSELYQDYSLWSSAAFTANTPVDQRDATDDPEGDGIQNLLEQAFGGDPEVNDISILPISETIEANGQSYLQISYRKPDFENGLTYTVETVTSLSGTWSSESSKVELISIASESGGFDRYTYRLVDPISATDKAFLRVEISETP